MAGKVKIGKKAHVNIKWKVNPLDYSSEAEENIKEIFAKKYSIDVKNINIEPQFITKNENGEEVPYASEIISNIQYPEFQQELFKRYIAENDIEDCDYAKIIEIDELINNNINYDVYEKHKKYTINWIKWSNFMSYGKENYVDLKSLDGLVLLSSEPANQGGKSTFCLDLFRFLLFGKVTSREDDWVLSKAFNRHIPEATEMYVEGSITIDGVEYVINRTLTRPSLDKRTDRSRITQTISYYKVINNERLSLEDEDNQSEVSNTETNKAIKEAIGNERDFDLMICINSDNLKGLISLKDTERGRLISRWIGLLPLEEKDKIARETFNKSINPKLLMNKLNKEQLQSEIEVKKEAVKSNEKEIENKKVIVSESEKKIERFTQEKETLLQSKREIDDNLLKVDVETLKTDIERLKEEGIKKKAEKERNEKSLSEIGEVNFDENEFEKLEKDKEEFLINVNTGITRCKQVIVEIDGLKKGEFCPTCGAKLKNVDNSKIIKEKEKEYASLVDTGRKNRESLNKTNEKISSLKENQKKYNEKVKLQLIIDKNEVDMENLRSKLREKLRLQSDIQKNKDSIENNNKIDIALNNVKINIDTEKKYFDKINNEINSLTNANTMLNSVINENSKNITIIEKEEKLVRNWKIYLEMIGKNGISKMVLRTVLPIINGNLKHLLDDVCDFDVEVDIDDHNDVAFYMIHDGVKSNLASGSGFEATVASLALRSVLAKISTFSKPSFVVFDEILGGVADENYDNVKKLYEKILADYKTIFQITHNKALYEWHNKFLTVKKENNVSKIETA